MSAKNCGCIIHDGPNRLPFTLSHCPEHSKYVEFTVPGLKEYRDAMDRVPSVSFIPDAGNAIRLGQSKKASFVESVVNVIVGYGIAVLSQILILPLFGVHISVRDNCLIALWFTGVSIGRSYLLRRIFNSVTVR